MSAYYFESSSGGSAQPSEGVFHELKISAILNIAIDHALEVLDHDAALEAGDRCLLQSAVVGFFAELTHKL